MHAILLFYACGGILSKYAAQYSIASKEFLLLYGLKMAILLVYAVLWQIVLKHFKLTTAFANKSVTVVWGLILGALFFQERVSILKVAASCMIMTGVCIAVSQDE